MTDRRAAAVAVVTAMLGFGTAAEACFMEAGLAGGLNVSHPSSISVLVATRRALDDGLPGGVDTTDPASNHRLLSSVYVSAQYLAWHASTEKLPGPGYSTLFLQSGLWMAYNSRGQFSRFHAAPAGEDETVVLLSDYILPALLAGGLSVSEAASRGLIVTSGPDGAAALEHFGATIDGFDASPIPTLARRQSVHRPGEAMPGEHPRGAPRARDRRAEIAHEGPRDGGRRAEARAMQSSAPARRSSTTSRLCSPC